jgi:hypothetical protein
MTVATIGDFGQALTWMRAGTKVRRNGWSGPGVFAPSSVWVALQVPSSDSKMGLPYLYVSTVGGDLVPYIPTHADLLALDWTTVLPEAS